MAPVANIDTESSEQDSQPAKPILMRNYLGQFYRRSLIVTLVTLSAVSLGVTALLTISLQIAFVSAAFIATFFILFIVFSGVTFALLWAFGRPFRDLVSEVVVVGGENTLTAPPNPNTHRYQEDGFKQILQTIYELAVKKEAPREDVKPGNGLLETGLNQTSTGIVILNHKREIVYSNKTAPVSTDFDGNQELEIVFKAPDTLEKWLDGCEKKSVHAEQTWTRLSDKRTGEHGHRVYDVIASYNKTSHAETILTLIDRTADYEPEEDDLDFIAFAAHELRGPITVIRGYLDVLQDEVTPMLEDDQAELLQRLVVSANRLSSYVNNILNSSRYDRQHLKVYMSEETMIDIYNTIKDDMEQRASAQHRLLTIDIPNTLPTVAADPGSIGEVMSNLIDNAIKYSNEGGQITVQARTISGFVEVSIIDRGIGMPSNVIPNLFHKFYRSHRSRETVAGTGIGLYITKAIVESHGGTISVTSTEKAGSTFTFTLPIYDTVADKIKAGDNSNKLLIKRGGGWIRNHAMYRG